MQEAVIKERLADPTGCRLVYIGSSPTPELWDHLWGLDETSVRQALAPSKEANAIVAMTARYLGRNAGTILEGGCGRGQFVAALHAAGYTVIGIDFAENTVRTLNAFAGHLDIRKQDLRALQLSDGSIAGYWSIGVIEHFWGGFDSLASEMARVIADDGYLFCSFPHLNLLRSIKMRLGLYRRIDGSSKPEGFYQFALHQDRVVARMADHGFACCHRVHQSGLKGLLGELGPISTLLQRLYDYPGSMLPVRAFRWLLNAIFTHLGCSHSILLIFRRLPRQQPSSVER